MADRFSIKVDPSLKKYVGRLLQSPTYRPIVDRLVDEAEQIRDDARVRWPQSRTGVTGAPRHKTHSRNEFDIIVRILPQAISVQLTNRAPYVLYIRSYLTGLTQPEQRSVSKLQPGEDFLDRELRITGERRKRSAWQELIRKPIRKQLPNLIDDLEEDLRRTADGGR